MRRRHGQAYFEETERPKKQRKLVIHETSTDDEVVPDTPPTTTILSHSSPVRDSPVNSNSEETRNVNHNEKKFIPPKVSHTESFHEEVRNSSITTNIFDMDANVNKGEGVSTHAAQGLLLPVLLFPAGKMSPFKVKVAPTRPLKNMHLLLQRHEVKIVRENVNLKIQELRDNMAMEVAELGHSYSNLHNKVDILDDAITKVVEWHTTLSPKVDKLGDDVDKGFENVEKILGELKVLMAKNEYSKYMFNVLSC
ncbi:unnamed protein product [Lactuca saligna]|uniref:Uncharacterized protein n=1 Tax=Lactuca saligna TaxID=75948 RepID=A0AA36E6I1_LACSI|nr:unnamed protein product [Lactuca saligna]